MTTSDASLSLTSSQEVQEESHGLFLHSFNLNPAKQLSVVNIKSIDFFQNCHNSFVHVVDRSNTVSCQLPVSPLQYWSLAAYPGMRTS